MSAAYEGAGWSIVNRANLACSLEIYASLDVRINGLFIDIENGGASTDPGVPFAESSCEHMLFDTDDYTESGEHNCEGEWELSLSFPSSERPPKWELWVRLRSEFRWEASNSLCLVDDHSKHTHSSGLNGTFEFTLTEPDVTWD